MPPHCDTLDGPVVKAIKMALEKDNVNYILPWVPEIAEEEIKHAFERTVMARKPGGEAQEVADQWLYETTVRLHRQGEGFPFTGLKPAGLDWGPVVPRAERSLQGGSPLEVIDLLTDTLSDELQARFMKAMSLRDFDVNDVEAGRRYVQAELGFVLFSHGLYTAITGKGEHEEGSASPHSHH